MTTTTLDSAAGDAARLLLGVARLGDGDLRGWWRSAAMDADIGAFILGNTFPRTARVAGAELLLLSAARRHDQVLSRPNAVHLYSSRLPLVRWVGGWLSEQKTGDVDPLIDELEGWRDEEGATKRLRAWAGAAQPGEVVASSLELGRVAEADISDPELLLDRARAMAASYVDMRAFMPAFYNVVA